MTDPRPTDADIRPTPEHIETRAELLPEEHAAGGSDDPEAQAEAILADSARRTLDPEGTQEASSQTLPD